MLGRPLLAIETPPASAALLPELPRRTPGSRLRHNVQNLTFAIGGASVVSGLICGVASLHAMRTGSPAEPVLPMQMAAGAGLAIAGSVLMAAGILMDPVESETRVASTAGRHWPQLHQADVESAMADNRLVGAPLIGNADT